MATETANDFFQSFEALIRSIEDDEDALDVDWDELEADDPAWIRCPHCASENVTMHVSFPDSTLDFSCDNPDCLAHSSVTADADPELLLADSTTE